MYADLGRGLKMFLPNVTDDTFASERGHVVGVIEVALQLFVSVALSFRVYLVDMILRESSAFISHTC